MDLSSLYAYQQPAQRHLKIPAGSSSSSSSMASAFFYGTLMAPPVLHRVIWGSSTPPTLAHASLLRIQPAILPAHRRHRVQHADYPAILPSGDDNACVRGVLVHGLTDGDIWRLDLFEGSEYVRRKVHAKALVEGGSVVDDAEPEIECEAYVWGASPSRLEPEEWDFEEFVRDKMKRWVGRDAALTDEGFQGK